MPTLVNGWRVQYGQCALSSHIANDKVQIPVAWEDMLGQGPLQGYIQGKFERRAA